MTIVQTSDDRFDNALGLSGASNWNRDYTCLLGRIVVSSHKQGIPDVDHLFHWNAENVSQLSYPIGFVNAMLGDINGCRSANSNRKLGNESIKDCFDLRPLGEIRVPFLLFFLCLQLRDKFLLRGNRLSGFPGLQLSLPRSFRPGSPRLQRLCLEN